MGSGLDGTSDRPAPAHADGPPVARGTGQRELNVVTRNAVVVGVDQSYAGRAAIEYAADLANSRHLPLRLVHAVGGHAVPGPPSRRPHLRRRRHDTALGAAGGRGQLRSTPHRLSDSRGHCGAARRVGHRDPARGVAARRHGCRRFPGIRWVHRPRDGLHRHARRDTRCLPGRRRTRRAGRRAAPARHRGRCRRVRRLRVGHRRRPRDGFGREGAAARPAQLVRPVTQRSRSDDAAVLRPRGRSPGGATRPGRVDGRLAGEVPRRHGGPPGRLRPPSPRTRGRRLPGATAGGRQPRPLRRAASCSARSATVRCTGHSSETHSVCDGVCGNPVPGWWRSPMDRGLQRTRSPARPDDQQRQHIDQSFLTFTNSGQSFIDLRDDSSHT